MAVQSNHAVCKSFKAGGDLSAKQFYFVKLSAADTVVVCSGATDIPVGVLQNKPAQNETAEVLILGESKVSADAALAVGVQIGTSADGQADAKTVSTDSTEYVCGTVTVASGAAADICSALINCINPHRAA